MSFNYCWEQINIINGSSEGLCQVNVCVASTHLFIPTSDEAQLQAGVRTQQAEFEPYIFESAASSDLETAATVAASSCGFVFTPIAAQNLLPEQQLQISGNALFSSPHSCIHIHFDKYYLH